MKRKNTTDLLPLYNLRKRGIVVTDPQGRQYVARLGPGIEIVDGVITAPHACDQLTAADPGGGGFELVYTSDGEPICCFDP